MNYHPIAQLLPLPFSACSTHSQQQNIKTYRLPNGLPIPTRYAHWKEEGGKKSKRLQAKTLTKYSAVVLPMREKEFFYETTA